MTRLTGPKPTSPDAARGAGPLVRLWRHLRSSEDGTAATELGLAGGFLLVLLLAVVEFGMILFQVLQLYSAVPAGAAYATIHGFSSAGIGTAVTTATNLGSSVCTGTSSSSSTLCTAAVNPSPPSQFCACPSGNTLTSANCNTRCANGFYPGIYVQVNGRYQIVAMLLSPYIGTVMPNPVGVSTTVRIGQGGPP